MTSIAEARGLFPGAERSPYMDVAVRGLLSTPVRRAVEAYLDVRMYEGGDKVQLHGLVDDMRSRFARLIRADADEVGIVKNVSEAVNAFAHALRWNPGDNVVLCPALEHPNNVFPWYNLRRRYGVQVREVAPVNGDRVPNAALAAAIDPGTRVVIVPAVTFSPGFVTDVAALSPQVRRHDALLFVDAAQSIGALDTDVHALDVDALAVATQKSLLAFYGTGFLYVRRAVADRLEPVYLARYGVDMGADAHETALASGQFRYASGARRFDLGNYNYLGAAAACASLALLESIGIPNIERHIRRLAHQLAIGFLDLGLPVVGGTPGADLGHIVALGTSGGGRHDTAEDPAMNDLYTHLTANGVRLSIRRGVLRFSLGVYNNEGDIRQVLELARAWARRKT